MMIDSYWWDGMIVEAEAKARGEQSSGSAEKKDESSEEDYSVGKYGVLPMIQSKKEQAESGQRFAT